MDAFAQAGVAAVTAFVGEMGDKSQLAVLAMAAQGRPRAVLAGSLAAIAVLVIAAATVGALLMDAMPREATAYASAAVFLVAGVLMVPWQRPESAKPLVCAPVGAIGAFLIFLLAEMGDKTQLGLAALATAGEAVPIAVGGIAGMSLNLVLAVTVGNRLAGRLPARTIRWAAAGLFLAGAAMALASAWVVPAD